MSDNAPAKFAGYCLTGHYDEPALYIMQIQY